MDNQSNQALPMNRSANDTNEGYDSSSPDMPGHLKLFFGVLVITCSIIGNFLVIAIVCSNAHMRTSFNYLIVNMAVSDLFVPFLAIPLVLTSDLLEERWFVEGRFGEALCKLSYFFADLAPSVSVFSLVIIALNRFVAIVFPMHVNIFNKKTTTRLLIIIPWILSIVIYSPVLYIFRLSYDNGYAMCIIEWEPAFDTLEAARVYIILILVLLFIIPFLSICVMYSIIIQKIYQSSENVSTMIQDNRSRKYRDRQIFYLSIVIIVAFGILWGPVIIYHTVQLQTFQDNLIVDFVFYIMQWSITVVNPFICILFNGNFRQGFRRLCCRFYWKSKRMTIQSRPTRTTKQSKDESSSRSFSVDRFQVITAI